jgi:hypothetical protein
LTFFAVVAYREINLSKADLVEEFQQVFAEFFIVVRIQVDTWVEACEIFCNNEILYQLVVEIVAFRSENLSVEVYLCSAS